MFAYRYTWIMKRGRTEEGLELCKTIPWPRSQEYGKLRIYTPGISPNLFVVELVVESQEAKDKWFAEWGATGKADAFWEKWGTLAERMVGEERWEMTELA